jgi:hypothetical protein
MKQLRTALTNGILTLVLVLSVTATVLVVNFSQADAADQPASIETEQVTYLPLTDAPPIRDITQQQFSLAQ